MISKPLPVSQILIWTIRAFYLLSSSIILTVRLIGPLRERFLAYGARENNNLTINKNDTNTTPTPLTSSTITQCLDWAARLKVPHSWFSHFYIVSVVSSLFCLSFYLYRYPVFSSGAAATTDPIIPTFCTILMLIQGCRRWLECHGVFVFLTAPQQQQKQQPTKGSRSQSKMWIGHYAIGLAFYVVTNVAIWAEYMGVHVGHDVDVAHWQTGRGLLTPRVLICTLLFLYASYKQHYYHSYLAGLKKYTLPVGPAFRLIVAPHYTAECAIYLALAVLDVAPQTQKQTEISSINWTLFCALVFVAVNLGVTADGTRTWMMYKFPEKKQEIQRRWRILPGIW
ncbi:hypothetical protein ABEF95_011532 [Exophiala dermatitidis]